MPNLLASYSADGPGHDEMLQAQGSAREAWEHLAGLAGLQSWRTLATRREELVSLLADQGLSTGVDVATSWKLDPLPVVVDSAEWRRLEAGLAQRARVLDAILADLYGPRRLLLDGILPAELFLGNPGFIRAADGTEVAGGNHLFYVSAQLVRNADGWAVLGDAGDLPAGLGYAMADRRAVAEVLGSAYRTLSVHRLGTFFQRFRASLDAISPTPGEDPRVVILVPGNRAMTFDQAYLADTLGIPLVTPADLIVADGRLWLRTLGDAEPVDVVLRQIPSHASDPVDLTAAAAGGVPGLIETAHAGSVTVVNPIGAGVLENPALLTYLPRVARHVLGEDLLLPSAVTYWCGERSMGSHVVANLERLVVTFITTGERVNGWDLTIGQRADLATQISATPHLWVGQERSEISTTPTVISEGLEAAPTTIHTFAVADGESYTVMPGGLGSTTARPGGHDSGDVAKDVWVLTGGAPIPAVANGPARHHRGVLAAGSAANLFDFGTHLERAEGVLRLARNRSTTPAGAPSVSMDDVAAATARLVSSAHLVRDHLTPEAWRAMSVLEQPAPLAQQLVNVLALSGVLHESVTRDRSWSLIMLGRRVERARFLLVTAIEAIEANDWIDPVPANSTSVANFLRLHDSLLSFRRHNQFRPAIPSVIELLLHGRSNPRSLLFCIEDAAAILGELPHHGADGEAAGLVEAIRERITAVALAEHPPARPELLEELAALVSFVERLHRAIRTQQLGPMDTAVWTADGETESTTHE